MIRHTLVPDKHCARFVADAALEVGALGDVVEEEAEQVVGLFLVVADDALGVDWVYVWWRVSGTEPSGELGYTYTEPSLP